MQSLDDASSSASDSGEPSTFAEENTLRAPLLRLLALRGIRQVFPRNTEFIREGQHGDEIFIILSGRVKVFGRHSDGREIIYGEYGPGEYVGEMSLDGGARSASVMAVETTVCAMVTRKTLREFIGDHPDFAFELISQIIGRVRRTTSALKDIALLDVYSRFKVLLEQLCVERAGQRIVPVPLTQQEIAHRIGASREMVSKLLKVLITGGYVELTDKRLIHVKAPLPDRY